MTIQDHRDLTIEERALLEWLLANGHEEAHAFVSQLSRVKVVSRCSCGCPSIDLTVSDKKEHKTGLSTILADVIGYSPEGVGVAVILHACDGQLSELEIYAHNGTTDFTLPKPESLTSWRSPK